MLRQEKKIILRVTDFESRLLINALLQWRNTLIQEEKPIEDINDLLVKLCNEN